METQAANRKLILKPVVSQSSEGHNDDEQGRVGKRERAREDTHGR